MFNNRSQIKIRINWKIINRIRRAKVAINLIIIIKKLKFGSSCKFKNVVKIKIRRNLRKIVIRFYWSKTKFYLRN